MSSMEDFIDGYMECALWASTDNRLDPETGGPPLDENYTVDDLEAETLARMRTDCGDFIMCKARLLERMVELLPERGWSGMGHDFWLTRNGHGAGFWDRYTEARAGDRDEVRTIGVLLSDDAHRFGPFNLYTTGDGQVYGEDG